MRATSTSSLKLRGSSSLRIQMVQWDLLVLEQHADLDRSITVLEINGW